jgi:hypothetical protein
MNGAWNKPWKEQKPGDQICSTINLGIKKAPVNDESFSFSVEEIL